MVVQHVLSFDTENWYDGNLYRRWTWNPDQGDARVLADVDITLEVLRAAGARATFFILGRLAVDHPAMVRQIAEAGHEIGCHSLEHVMLRHSTPGAYLDGLRRARAMLQDLTGQPVLGHRAPSWSLNRRVAWGVDMVAAAGFTYDSSVFPMLTPLYGEATVPTTPFWLSGPGGARLLELPPAVSRLGWLGVPFGGGFYWRALPLWLIRLLLGWSVQPQVTYLHPWELNPAPLPIPRDLPPLPRLVLTYGLRNTRYKLERLLQRFSFRPFSAIVSELMEDSALPTLHWAGM